MIGDWKTERNKSQTDTQSYWQANCRDQLSLKKLGAGGVNTNVLTSDISGRFKRGGNSSMGLTFVAYLYTHGHTHMCTCVCAHTHIHMKLLLSLEAQYYKYEKYFPKGKHSEEQQPLDLIADHSLASAHASLGEGQVGARRPAFA